MQDEPDGTSEVWAEVAQKLQDGSLTLDDYRFALLDGGPCPRWLIVELDKFLEYVRELSPAERAEHDRKAAKRQILHRETAGLHSDD